MKFRDLLESKPTESSVKKVLKKGNVYFEIFRVERKKQGFGGGTYIAIFFNDDLKQNDIDDTVNLLKTKFDSVEYKNDAIIVR